MPADHNLAASVVLHYQLQQVGSQVLPSVNNTFVPHHSEITLPEKKALIDMHDRFVTPAKAFPADSPIFGFAVEARHLACNTMHAARQHILGGLALREDGVAGIFFANMLPEQIDRKARIMLSDYGNGCPSAARTRFMDAHGFHERGASAETIEKTMQLIIGCGSLASTDFKTALGFRIQETDRDISHALKEEKAA